MHGEIVVECDAAQAEAVTAWLRRAMVDGVARLLTPEPVAVAVETRVGRRWGEEEP
jgi:hypothetical protein